MARLLLCLQLTLEPLKNIASLLPCACFWNWFFFFLSFYSLRGVVNLSPGCEVVRGQPGGPVPWVRLFSIALTVRYWQWRWWAGLGSGLAL